MRRRFREGLLACVAACWLTYASLLVPGHAIVVCSSVYKPVYCPVLAYGFRLPFLADSQGISPVGSVSREPLSMLTGEDDLLWPQLWLAVAFWLLVVLGGGYLWKRRSGQWREGR